MGMCGCLVRVSRESLERYLRDTGLMDSHLLGTAAGDDIGYVTTELQRQMENHWDRIAKEAEAHGLPPDLLRRQIMEKFAAINAKASRSEALNPPETAASLPRLDLDKQWHLVAYLLTGISEMSRTDPSSHPLHAVIFGDKPVAEDHDTGYGPACYVAPERVKELSSLLSEVTPERLRSRLAPERLDDVYPIGCWDRECREDPERIGALARELVEEVKRFYAEAAHAGEAMIMYIA